MRGGGGGECAAIDAWASAEDIDGEEVFLVADEEGSGIGDSLEGVEDNDGDGVGCDGAGDDGSAVADNVGHG